MEFKASNGVEVQRYALSLQFARDLDEGWLEPWAVVALREYFRAERDEELGRWRDPKNLNHVAYRQGNEVSVVDEVHGTWGQWDRASASSDRGRDSLASTAHAYFEAHPEPKPWDSAKPGEVWSLGIGGGYHGESIAVVETEEGLRFIWGVKGGDIRNIAITDRSIDYGTRIWPESD